MINKFTLAFILFLTPIISNCQNGDEYQVFALKYIDGQNEWLLEQTQMIVYNYAICFGS
jgi:hypothetical protein